MRFFNTKTACLDAVNKVHQEYSDTVYQTHVTFEPNNGYVGQIYCYHRVPDLEADFECYVATEGGKRYTDPPKNMVRLAPVATPQRKVREPGATPSQTGETAPSGPPARGKTRRVWEIADSMPTADRKSIIDACIAEGINKSTAGVQYGKWKKSKGM